jgi:hypothetical protein
MGVFTPAPVSSLSAASSTTDASAVSLESFMQDGNIRQHDCFIDLEGSTPSSSVSLCQSPPEASLQDRTASDSQSFIYVDTLVDMGQVCQLIEEGVESVLRQAKASLSSTSAASTTSDHWLLITILTTLKEQKDLLQRATAQQERLTTANDGHGSTVSEAPLMTDRLGLSCR